MEPEHSRLSIKRQCELLGLARSSWYYQPVGESPENLALMRLLDEQYTETPHYGVRRMRAWLRTQGHEVNDKRVRRLLRKMGLMAIYPKPRLSQPGKTTQVYPYLLKGVTIETPDQVWSTDITYIRLRGGFIYLTAVIDWYSRYVLAFEVSNSLDTGFCLSALDQALAQGRPSIFNTDQGSQFTSDAFIERLKAAEVKISWDGRGRALDNVFVERLWRSVKQEEVYLNEYRNVPEAYERLSAYFEFYNERRRHQSLGYRTPIEIYLGRKGPKPSDGDLK